MMTVGQALNFSSYMWLTGFCLWLCRKYEYLDVPYWLIGALAIPPTAFWLLILTMAFIVWALVVIEKAKEDLRREAEKMDEK